MQSSIKITGVGQMLNNLEKLEKAVQKEAGNSAMKSAEEIRDRIRQNAPLGPTGNLKRSPVARKYGNVAIAGVDRKIAPHAHLVEFGTSRAPAHPFFRPAVSSKKNRVAENFREDIGRGIKRSF
jgi:HK97 gp10 family phage protein